MKQNTDIHERISCLETKVDLISANIDKILENHLPHLEAKVQKLEDKFYYSAGALAIIIPLLVWLVNKFFS